MKLKWSRPEQPPTYNLVDTFATICVAQLYPPGCGPRPTRPIRRRRPHIKGSLRGGTPSVALHPSRKQNKQWSPFHLSQTTHAFVHLRRSIKGLVIHTLIASTTECPQGKLTPSKCSYIKKSLLIQSPRNSPSQEGRLGHGGITSISLRMHL
jgi:hypothetical protein